MKKLFILLALLPFAAQAETPPEVQPMPAPPVTAPPSSGLDVDDGLEPEVSIIKRDDAVVHEYRMNGVLYMVKVIPVAGPPYYLIDSKGDGNLIRHSEIDPGLVVPSWMIFRW